MTAKSYRRLASSRMLQTYYRQDGEVCATCSVFQRSLMAETLSSLSWLNAAPWSKSNCLAALPLLEVSLSTGQPLSSSSSTADARAYMPARSQLPAPRPYCPAARPRAPP